MSAPTRRCPLAQRGVTEAVSSAAGTAPRLGRDQEEQLAWDLTCDHPAGQPDGTGGGVLPTRCRHDCAVEKGSPVGSLVRHQRHDSFQLTK